MDSFAPMRLAMAQGFNLQKKLNKVGDRDSTGSAGAGAGAAAASGGDEEAVEEGAGESSGRTTEVSIEDDIIPDMRESTARAASFVGNRPVAKSAASSAPGVDALHEGEEDEDED